MDINRSVIYDGAGDDEDHVFHQSDNQLQRNDSNDYVRGMANTERGNLHSMSTFKQEGNDKLYGVSIYTGKSLKQSNNQWGRSGPVSDGSGNYSRNINYTGDRTIDETFYTRTHNKNTNNGAISQNDIDHRRTERLPKCPTEYDANSKSSFGETDATPQWANMALKPNFTDLRQKWPRISLRALNYRPSDPTLVHDGDILLTDKDNKERTEKTKKTACCIVVGILLIIMVTAPAVVLIVLASDTQQDSTDIYAVNMELSVDEDFTSDHNDTESAVYKSFTSKFCSEIDTVYRNTTTGFGEGYKGCAVNNVKKGSIIVIFVLYITGVSQTQVNTLDAKLNDSLQINSNYLGTFIVIVGSIKITSFTIIRTVPVVSTPSQVVTSAITSVSTEDITTSSILVSITKADSTTVTTTPDATTSTTEADTIKSTTTPDMTTSTTKARTTTSTTTPDTTTSTTEADTITSTTAPDTTASTTETNSTTEANSTTQTTEADSTTPSTTAGTTTETDTTTTTIVTDTTTSTTADTTTSSTEDDTTTSTTEADTTISTTELATTTSTTEADTTSTTAPDTTSTTEAITTTSTTAVGTTTSTTETVTTTFTTKTDITTSTIVPDTTTTTAPDTPTSTMIAETTKTTTATETTTSTAPADTTTSTSASDTTITTTESDATKLTTATDKTTSTTASDTTITTTESDATKLTTATDKTTSTTEVDTTTSTTVADTTKSTRIADTSTATTATDATTITEANTIQSTATVSTTTSKTETDTTTTTSTTEAETTTSTTEADTSTQTPEADTTTLKTTAGTTTSTTIVGTTTSTTEADTTTFTMEDTTTPTTEADTFTSTTDGDTTTSITEADTTVSTTEGYTTTSTTAADTSTSTTEADTTTSTMAADTTTSMTEADTTTSTITADTTTSTTEADTTTSTIEAETTTSTAATTITSTIVADTTTSTAASTITSTITETTGTTITTTTVQQADVNCPDALFTIGNPAVYNCTLSGTEFTEISVSNLDRTKLASIDKNGTVTYEPLVALTVKLVPAEKIELMFSDITCSDEGIYEITVTGESGDTKSTGRIAVQRVPVAPTLNMHADQVIDLQFYRSGSENECKAEVGYPPGYLVIEVKNNNSSTYEELPPLDISFVDNTTISGNCTNKQLLKFGMNYTSAMNNGKIRCRVESPVVGETISTEKDLFLIPRDICTCNTINSGVKRGHPKRCDVSVACVARDYPFGVLCPSSQCRNSVSGECSNNCSEIICNEEVPQDFCTTPPPSTTTPAPSLYISCNESVGVLIYTETVSVICVLNQTSNFQVVNITKVTTSVEDVAEISQNGNVKLLTDDDNIDVTYDSAVIKVTIKNVSCLDEGAYRFLVQFGEDIATAQTSVSVLQKPNNPATLTLDADQIADLGFYRGDRLHSCVADIGYPAGTLNVEILNEGESEFKELDLPSGTDTKSNCMVNRKIEFGIEFTSAMNGAIIRCVVKNDNFEEKFISFSKNETASLIPHDFCINSTVTRSFNHHPEDCTKFVQCEGKVAYGKSCPTNLCFGIASVNCDFCTNVQCKSEITTEPEITTTEPTTTTTDKSITSQIDISCNESVGVLIYTETVSVICVLNQTSNFQVVNITKVTTSVEDVAEISQNGNVKLLTDDDNIDVTYDSAVIKVTFKNVSCLDEGAYRFLVQFGEDIATAQTSVSVLQKPNNPATLTLDADQIADLGFYRGDRLHSCVADIGYPAGTLNVEILNEGESEFKELNLPSGTDTKSNCMVNRKIEFGIEFTSAMNGAIIRCVVKNDNFEEKFISFSKNETASLIPHDFCINSTVTRSFNHHPEDCTKFVQCEGKVAYGKSCPTNLCFGIASVNCDFCTNVQCKSEITTEPEITTTEPTTTTTDKSITSQIAMNCTKNSNFIGSGPANITCSFTRSASLNGINISRSVNSSSSVLGTLNSVGTLSDQSPDGIQLQYTPTNYVVLSVEISTMSCADQGTYDFIATQQDNVTYYGQEMLIAKAKPSNPTLDLSHQTVVDELSQASVCKAQVGNPAGSIEVQVKKPNEANFTTYKNFQTTVTPKQLECNTEVEHKFSLAFTSEWNNSKIRCTVKNDETIDANEDYSSNEDTLILIPDNYCNGVTRYTRHPRADCAYYIQCANDRIFSFKCQGMLCFNGNTTNCDHCYNVNNATCNFT